MLISLDYYPRPYIKLVFNFNQLMELKSDLIQGKVVVTVILLVT